MCFNKILNWMGITNVHGGLDDKMTTQLQFTSQMSNYALTNHTHTGITTVSVSSHTHSQYLTTAALSNHLHTQYLTTATMTNHSHTNYLNITDKGNVFFRDGNNVTFGSSVSLMNTTITASINAATISGTFNTAHTHTEYINTSVVSDIYFMDDNNVKFGSIGAGNSTTITASVNIPNHIYFLNSNGHTFSSSNNGLSTFYWVRTN